MLLIWQFGIPLMRDWASSGSVPAPGAQNSTPTPATGSSNTPCPQAAASYLPSATGTLVARYQSDRHIITICQASDGQLYYDGQVKGKPSDSEHHISLPAAHTSQGFIAHNGPYTYEVRDMRIIVTNSGSVLSDSPLTAA